MSPLSPLRGRESLSGPETELTNLVSSDAAFILEIPQPAEQWQRLTASPFWSRVRQSTLAAAWQTSRSFQKWEALQALSVQETGATASSHFARLASQGVLLALFIPEGEDPQGVIVTQATEEGDVDAFLEIWNRLDGQPTLETVTTANGDYIRRVRPEKPEKTLFLARSKTLLAVSDRESLIRQVAERMQQSTSSSLTQFPPFLKGQSHLEQRTGLFFWLNSRAWDRLLPPQPGDAAGRLLAAEHQRIQGVAGRLSLLPETTKTEQNASLENPSTTGIETSLSQGEGLSLEMVILSDRPTSRPKPSFTGSPQPWPSSTLLAIGGEIPMAPLLQILDVIASAESSRDWPLLRRLGQGLLGGKDPLQDLLALPEGRLLACLLSEDQRLFDLDLYYVSSTAWSASQERSLIDLARLAGQVISLEQNRHEQRPLLVFHSEQTPGMTQFWLSGGGWIWSPVVQIAAQQIRLATSPELLCQPDEATSSVEATSSPQSESGKKDVAEWAYSQQAFMWFSGRALREHLARHPTALSQWNWQPAGDPLAGAVTTGQITDFFDQAALGFQITPFGARLTITLEIDSVSP